MKCIKLTFDDGPHPVWTEMILDILREHKVKAAFFIVGENAFKYPNIVKKIIREGHNVGNHTMTHGSLLKYSKEIEAKEIIDYHKKFYSEFGEKFTLFRPTWGILNPEYRSALKKLNYKIMMWDIDTRDFINPFFNVIDAIRKRENDNLIILSHDGVFKSIIPWRWHTVFNLKKLLNSKKYRVEE